MARPALDSTEILEMLTTTVPRLDELTRGTPEKRLYAVTQPRRARRLATRPCARTSSI